MVSAILTLIIAFLCLIALMIIHEFGHFIIAKKFGVKVEEFGIGYPPRIFGKKIGETIYSINLIPLGAFVKIYGEEGGVDDYRSFTSLKIWQRILIVIVGLIATVLAAYLPALGLITLTIVMMALLFIFNAALLIEYNWVLPHLVLPYLQLLFLGIINSGCGYSVSNRSAY